MRHPGGADDASGAAGPFWGSSATRKKRQYGAGLSHRQCDLRAAGKARKSAGRDRSDLFSA